MMSYGATNRCVDVDQVEAYTWGIDRPLFKVSRVNL